MSDIDTPDAVALNRISYGQDGYFTSRQGSECGFSPQLLAHHVRSGRYEHVRRGLYRLRVALIRLRKRAAFERFLARLTTAESGGWMLKGAFALELRLGLRTRATKDIDLARADVSPWP